MDNEFLSFFTEICNNSLVKNFFLDFLISISTDTVKDFFKKAKKEESFELQLYNVIRDTFEQFYNEFKLNFDSKIVMEAFAEAIKKFDNLDKNIMTKKIISDVVGLSLSDEAMKKWISIFKIVCSQKKYQWVYNVFTMQKIDFCSGLQNLDWMDKYMQGNCCKIQCDFTNELLSIFENVRCKIQNRCWHQIKLLIYEIVLNAQEHGKAKKCLMNITENDITIIDDGKRFNPLDINANFVAQGGGLKIKSFQEEYPEIELKSRYNNNCNEFSICLKEKSFDVNCMSEIIVPNMLEISKFTFKYSRGKFKYYYIDVDEIARKSGNSIFVPISMSYELYARLSNECLCEPENKVFIYFSDMTREDYQWLYHDMKKVLEKLNLEKIILVTGTENYFDCIDDI